MTITVDALQASDGAEPSATAPPSAVEDAADAHDSGPGPDAPAGEDTDLGYDRIIWVPPETLTIGPNVREEDAEPDEGQVKDFAANGVDNPIKAYRDEAGDVIVTVGKLRTLGSVAGRVPLVPVWLRPPPVEDEKAALIGRISEQFRENRHRKKMTRGDEYRAYEQLKIAGLNATKIGKTLAVSRSEVQAAFKVGKSELATKAGDRYDLTLDQLAVIAEFDSDGDLATAKELIICAVESPHNFDMKAQRRRNDRKEEKRLAASVTACTRQLAADGVVVFEGEVPRWHGDARPLTLLRPSPDHEPGTELTLDEHTQCPGHGAWVGYTWEDQVKIAVRVYGCSDYVAHGHVTINAPAGQAIYDSAAAEEDRQVVAENEEELRRANLEHDWVINCSKDAEAAVPGRHEWLAGLARRKSLPKGARKLLTLHLLDGTPALANAMDDGHSLAYRLLGITTDEQRQEFRDRVANATDAQAAAYELFLISCALEEEFSLRAWRDPAAHEKAYMSMAITMGYDAPDIDLKVLNPDNRDDVIDAMIAAEPAADTPGADPDEGAVDDLEALEAIEDGSDADASLPGSDDDSSSRGEPGPGVIDASAGPAQSDSLDDTRPGDHGPSDVSVAA